MGPVGPGWLPIDSGMAGLPKRLQPPQQTTDLAGIDRLNQVAFEILESGTSGRVFSPKTGNGDQERMIGLTHLDTAAGHVSRGTSQAQVPKHDIGVVPTCQFLSCSLVVGNEHTATEGRQQFAERIGSTPP